MTATDLITSDSPNVKWLHAEFTKGGSTGDYFNRLRQAEDQRLCRWTGQSDDGKKHQDKLPEGEQAFPFDGASDTRVFQADEIINENVAIETAAFWRSDIRVQGVGPEDIESASSATTFMDWLVHDKLARSLEDEVEYSAQFTEWYGWSALHVSWDREIAFRQQKILMAELETLAQRIAQSNPAEFQPEQAQILSLMRLFPELIRQEESTDQAIDVLRFIYRTYVLNNLPAQLTESDIPELPRKEARRHIKALRDKGETSLPMPYLCRNQPCITALKPWRDVILPSDTTDTQNARVVFMVRYLSEANLKAMELADGWDSDWIEKAAKTKGMASNWSWTDSMQTQLSVFSPVDQENELIEVIYSYRKQVAEDGVMAVWYTVWNAHVPHDPSNPDLVAKHEQIKYPPDIGYPMVIARRERLDRVVVASRGVPEITLTSQREEKVQRDAIVDLSSMAVMPPILESKVGMQQQRQYGPATRNQYTLGHEPKFMDVPTKGLPVASEHLAYLSQRVDRYFGRFAPEIHPAHSQLLQEPRVRRFLSAWSQALRIAYQLTAVFAPEMIARVTGRPPGPADPQYDFVFHFDVARLNPDLMVQKMEALSKLLPEDAGGVIDRAKLMRVKLAWIDPQLARLVTTDQQAASQKMFEDTSNELVRMFAGNEAMYRDAANDPTAQTRLQYTQQIIGRNMKYLTSLAPEVLQELFQGQVPNLPRSQPDPIFSQYVMKWVENLKQGVVQQQNQTVGRIGVQPAGMMT